LRLHVAGTGSFAAEVVDFAAAAGLRVEGLIEMLDRSRVGTTVHGLPVIDADDLPEPAAKAVIGMSGERRALWARLAERGWTATTVIHPRAAISPSAVISSGTVIGPLAVVGAESALGDNVLLGRGSLIGHHVRLDAGVVVNPGANIAGNCHVGAGAMIEIGATIAHGLTIGAGALVAAGAVVLRDVPAATRVQGVPAHVYAEA
jgi:sugar O-acyltransferase (sialic acid O-acetyltransferase NeuD family)